MPRSRRRPSKTSLSTVILVIIVVVVLAIEAISQAGEETASRQPVREPVTGTWYTLYFTEPGSSSAEALRGGPPEALVEAIQAANSSIRMAAYQFNLPQVRDALLEAAQRGVDIQIVTDSDYLDEVELQDLVDAGIPVLGDRREGLMHNKFIVIDESEVWTGSMNLSVNDAYRNNNNFIRISSERLAENYLAEFNEMFVDDQFGPTSPENIPYPTITLDDTLVEVYFSPEAEISTRLVELLEDADEQIVFLAYSFTSDDLAAAMLNQAQAGVSISGVFEAAQYRSNTGTEYDAFREAGLDVRLDGNPRNMHHKVMVIDGTITVTGSYNFSANAENRNDENLLIIHNPEIAQAFLEEFEQVYAIAVE